MPVDVIGGQELYWERRGTGEPVVLIQGMSGHHRAWGDEFLAALEGEGFELVLFDNRGMGASGRADEGFTIPDLAGDVMGLLDQLGLEAVHVVGLSLGGMVAQEVALRGPDRVRTLTLLSTSPGGEGSIPLGEEAAGMLMEAWSSGSADQVLQTAWRLNVSPALARDDDAYARFRGAVTSLKAPLRVTMAQAVAGAAHDTSGRLASLQPPTLIVHGDLDRVSPVSNAHLIARLAPQVQLEIVAGAGHLVGWDQPERLAGLIAAHARRHD